MTMYLGNGTIAAGASGSEVKDLQQILAGQGYSVGPIDGIFGTLTVTAVKAFQASKGLIPDGIVGPLTWDALRGRTPAPVQGPVFVPPPSLPAPLPAEPLSPTMKMVLYGVGALAFLSLLFGGKGKKGRR